MLDTLKTDYPAVVEEVTKAFSLGEIQKILQGLLDERVSIRNLVVILETLGDFSSISKNTSYLVEKTRQALRRQLCLQYADERKIIHVLTMDPAVEKVIIESRTESAGTDTAALDAVFHRRWINAAANALKAAQGAGQWPLVLCSEAARPLVRSSTVRDLPELVILSVPEIEAGFNIETLGEIRLGEI